MAPFFVFWAMCWVIINMPAWPTPQSRPWEFVRFIAAIVFLIYCLIVALVNTGHLAL